MIARRATLAALDLPGIAAAYDAVYAGYATPIHFDSASTRRLLRANDIVPDASPLWFAPDGGVAALAAVGLRGTASYLGGFGIVPGLRGRGLAHPLLAAALAAAGARGAREMELEVLADNAPAIAVYARAGFALARSVSIFTRLPAPIDADEREISAADPLELMRAVAEPDGATWQNRFVALGRSDALEALVAGDPERPGAYVIFREGRDALGIAALGGEPAALARLLATLISTTVRKPVMAVNVAEAGAAADVLAALGFARTARQHVMHRTLQSG